MSIDEVTDQQFEQLVARAIDDLPKRYTDNMNNVAFVIELDPTAEQSAKLHIVNGMLLFGLYEGIPLPRRGAGYNLVLPDKITIFKNPIVTTAYDLQDLQGRVRNTVWHELAHHYGLDHGRIHEIERQGRE